MFMQWVLSNGLLSICNNKRITCILLLQSSSSSLRIQLDVVVLWNFYLLPGYTAIVFLFLLFTWWGTQVQMEPYSFWRVASAGFLHRWLALEICSGLRGRLRLWLRFWESSCSCGGCQGSTYGSWLRRHLLKRPLFRCWQHVRSSRIEKFLRVRPRRVNISTS